MKELAFVDVNGFLRSKLVGDSAPEATFCDAVLLHDRDGHSIVLNGYGSAAGNPDVVAQPSGAGWKSTGHGSLPTLCDLFDSTGAAHPLDSRALASRVFSAAKLQGFRLSVGVELEFAMLATNPDASRSDRGSHLYSRFTDRERRYVDEVWQALDAAGIEVWQASKEFDRGQLEVALAPTDPLVACDHVTLLKEILASTAKRLWPNGEWAPTFDPQPSTQRFGSGLHFHISSGPESKVDWQATVAARLPDLIAIACSGVAGLRRLENVEFVNPALSRMASGGRRDGWLREIDHGPSPRLELRYPDSLSNPYLALATAVSTLLSEYRDVPVTTQELEIGNLGEVIQRSQFLRSVLGDPLWLAIIEMQSPRHEG